MDQLNSMTTKDWAKLESLAALNPSVRLDRSPEGICVIMEGFGVFHPKSFLDLIEEMPCA